MTSNESIEARDSAAPRGPVGPGTGFLRGHLGVILGAAAICCALAFASETLVWRFRAQQQSEVLARSEISAGVVQQVVLRRIEAVSVLHGLSQSWFALRERGNLEGARAIEEHLRTTASSGAFGFVQVALIGADGWMVWSSLSGSEGRLYLGDREHFQVHAEGRLDMFISRPVLGRVSNRWTLQFTKPLYDAQGRFGGVTVVSLDLYNLSDALAEIQTRDFERTLLLRDGGLIVAASPDPEQSIGQELPATHVLRRREISARSGSVSAHDQQGPRFAGWYRLPGTNLTAVDVLDAGAAASDSMPVATATRAVALALGLLTLAAATLTILARERATTQRNLERAERERGMVEQAHQLFERRVNALPVVVFGGIARPDGAFGFTFVSENVARITGWEQDHLRSAASWDLVSDGVDGRAHAAFYRQVVEEGRATREFRIHRPDGTLMLVRENLRAIDVLADGSAELAGFLRDITSERDIELKAEASGRLAILGEMATGLAHELNQPLSVMSLAAENCARALRRRGADGIPDVLGRLERISQQGRRARDIVDHLRVFGRPFEDGLPERTDLVAAVEGAEVLTRAALRDAGVTLERDVPAGLPPVMARLVPLEQTIVNVLLNARDAIEEKRPGHGRVRMVVRQVDDRTLALDIADNGGGIPAQVAYRIFEPFYTTKPIGKGTGLGLPFCHATMRAFGGSIAVSNADEGAVFTLLLKTSPVLPDKAETIPDPSRLDAGMLVEDQVS